MCNHRPISLLCVAIKVAEGCIPAYNCIPTRTFRPMNFNTDFSKIGRRRRSLVTFLMTQYVIQNNGQSDILYIDLNKGFHTIPHD